MKRPIRFAAALLSVLVFHSVLGQPYPSKPLHIIIPFAAGGVTDIFARTLAPVITEQMGQAVVVDNRPGGASFIGMTACARAAPDGYTICIANPDSVSYHPHLCASLPYNPETDFAPIIKGSGQANPALLSGEADLGWMGIGQASPHFKSGKLKPLVATGTPQRLGFMPDLPTLAEEGGDPALRSYFGVFAPARTPGAIVDRLNTELARAIRTPPLLEFFRNYTLEAIDNSAAEFAAFVKADRENAGKVFRGMGIKPGAAPQ